MNMKQYHGIKTTSTLSNNKRFTNYKSYLNHLYPKAKDSEINKTPIKLKGKLFNYNSKLKQKKILTLNYSFTRKKCTRCTLPSNSMRRYSRSIL